jgi:hypothetical protein
MSDVPNDSVVGAIEGAMQGKSQLDHAQVGTEMTTGFGDLIHQENPDLVTELIEFPLVECRQIGRSLDASKQGTHDPTGYPDAWIG